MKKVMLMCTMMMLGLTGISAQDQGGDANVFNHLSVGVGAGILTGATVELATPVTDYFTLRAGYNFIPSFKYSTDIDLDFINVDNAYRGNFPEDIEVEGKPNLGTAHVLVDIHPFKGSSFRVTAGAYFGKDNIIDVYNKEDGALSEIYKFNHRQGQYAVLSNNTSRIGLDMGDYFLEPDANGNVEASIKVKAFRPYLGLGFGRAVPQKHRVTCNFDLGVQFWGTPEVFMQEKKLEKEDVGDDGSAFFDYLSKATICPVLSFRIVGRIF